MVKGTVSQDKIWLGVVLINWPRKGHQMGTFAETAIIGYHLMFSEQGKWKFAVFVFQL